MLLLLQIKIARRRSTLHKELVMKTIAILLLLVILLVAEGASSLPSVNVTRVLRNDKFTNPNQTAVEDCIRGHASQYVDTCKSYDSIADTRALCYSACCENCWCRSAYPTYLAHLGKCVNLSELNLDVFGQGSNGCGPCLDENRNNVCDVDPWKLPLLGFQQSQYPLILFCRHDDEDDIASCAVQAAQNSGYGRWRDIINFGDRFWVKKTSDEFYFQWNRTATSQLRGNVLVINILCKQKKRKPDYPACFVFKSTGTQTVALSPQQTTTTTTTSHSTTKPTKRPTTASSPGIESSTTQKRRETTTLREPQTGKTFSDVTTAPTQPRSPEEDKLSDKSRDKGGSTVVVVSVVCTLLVLVALVFVAVCFLRKRKRSKETVTINQSNLQCEIQQRTAQGKPDDHVYQGQNDVYQLLRRDGKPREGDQWEPPAYQGLTKGASEGAWGEGEVYTNPSLYQDLRKDGTTCNENLPVYHPLIKQQQSTITDTPEYEYGYLVLIGEHDKATTTADTEENPYYYKVEPTVE